MLLEKQAHCISAASIVAEQKAYAKGKERLVAFVGNEEPGSLKIRALCDAVLLIRDMCYARQYDGMAGDAKTREARKYYGDRFVVYENDASKARDCIVAMSALDSEAYESAFRSQYDIGLAEGKESVALEGEPPLISWYVEGVTQGPAYDDDDIGAQAAERLLEDLAEITAASNQPQVTVGVGAMAMSEATKGVWFTS